MNIAQGLKHKNRLIGKLEKQREIFRRENARRSDSLSGINRATLFLDLNNLQKDLIETKARINQASAPISSKLVELAELKGEINFINTVPTREGEEKVRITDTHYDTYVWESYMNQHFKDRYVEELEGKINSLQDEIDKFNATTEI